MTDEEIDVDPNAMWCPWCRGVRWWKGVHSASKHPEKWEAFKDQYKRTETEPRTQWEKK